MRAAFILIPLLLLAACAAPSADDAALARSLVYRYYEALDSEDYATMYGLISDGFKHLEPTAKDFETFKAHMAKFYETADGISVISAEVAYASRDEVGVNYNALIRMKDGTRRELTSTFTLRKKPEGWRLIHPYGEHIDES